MERLKREKQKDLADYVAFDELEHEFKKVCRRPYKRRAVHIDVNVNKAENQHNTTTTVKEKEPKQKKKTASEELEAIYTREAAIQNEIDNKFIAKTLAMRYNKANPPLPTTSYNCKSLTQAIEKCFQESGSESYDLFIRDRSFNHYNIGKMCQVYWEGDNEWFYGRILTYSILNSKYFIYYIEDSTGEWVNPITDPIIIVDDILLFKSWPVMKYILNEPSIIPMKKKKGYNKNNEYIEYFVDMGSNTHDYAFVNQSQLSTFIAAPNPIKISNKLALCIEHAMIELEVIRNTQEELIAYAINTFYENMTNQTLIGYQFNIIDTNQIGLIVNYCQGTCEHLFILDKDQANPVWMMYSEEIMSLSDEQIPYIPIADPDIRVCSACSINSDNLNECSSCHSLFHSTCMPSTKLGIEKDLLLCWKCIHCEGCGASMWNKPYCLWNKKWIRMGAPDERLGLCGDCVYTYKHALDFCPVCFKIYPPETEYTADVSFTETNLNINPIQSQNNQMISAVVTTNSSELPSVATDELLGMNNLQIDESMVQCNECSRWVHSMCEGIDQAQYESMTKGTHPVWGDEYLCPGCRVNIPKKVIQELSQEDVLDIFGEPVTEAVAENYFDVIRNPMDLKTMNSKAARGQYKSMQSLRQDFELMCMNAMVYNKAGDEYFNASLQFYEKTEAYFNALPRQTHITACGGEILKMASDHKSSVKQLLKASHVEKQNINQESNHFYEEQKKKAEARAAERSARMLLRKKRLSGEMIDPEAMEDVDFVSAVPGDAQLIASAASIAEEIAPPKIADVVTVLDTPATTEIEIVTSGESADPNPSCSFAHAIYSIHSDDAFYLSCLDCCLVCGSSGQDSTFIFCIDCGEAFHSFCVTIPLHSMSEMARLTWRCNNCKLCEICETASYEEEASLVFCDACDKAYHMKCLSPVLTSTPAGTWICALCCDCRGLNDSPCLENQNRSWGFVSNICFICQKNAEEILLSISRCTVCNEIADESFAKCHRCNSRIHIRCSLYPTEEYVGNAYGNYTCPTCAPILLSSQSESNSISCHLGEYSPAVWDLLSKVSSIQRSEQAIGLSLRRSLADICRKSNLSIFWNNDRIILRSVVKLAVARLNFLRSSPISGPFLDSFNVPPSQLYSQLDPKFVWLRNRAAVFVRCFSIKENEDHFFRNDNISTSELKNQSALAAAFVFIMEKELRNLEAEKIFDLVSNLIMRELSLHETLETGNSSIVIGNPVTGAKLGSFSITLATGEDNSPIPESLNNANAKLLLLTIRKMLQALILPPVDVSVSTRPIDHSELKVFPERVKVLSGASTRSLRIEIDGNKLKRYCDESFKKKDTYKLVDCVDGDGYYSKQHKSHMVYIEAASRSDYRKVSMLQGWQAECMGSIDWADPRICVFCCLNDEFPQLGRLLPSGNNSFAHVNCLRASSGITEVDGILQATDDAKLGNRTALCSGCGHKGANVACSAKGCRRVFHLPCAVMLGGHLGEFCSSSEHHAQKHSITVRYHCPEHVVGGYRDQASDYYSKMTLSPNGVVSINRESPPALSNDCISPILPLVEPYRCIQDRKLVGQNIEESIAKDLCTLNRPCRTGALVVHSLGTICSTELGGSIDNSRLYFNKEQIFPYRFRSTRIFWSTKVPFTRTLYVFEVLSEDDLTDDDSPTEVELSLGQISSHDKPKFKITIMNDGEIEPSTNCPTHLVLLCSTVEDMYEMICNKVLACHQSVYPEKKRRSADIPAYGLNAYHFFGLGQSFVRQAIEMSPYSIAAVYSECSPQYQSIYVMFTNKEAAKFDQIQYSSKFSSMNTSGCARAQGWDRTKNDHGARRSSKLLTKTTDEDVEDSLTVSGGGGDEADQEIIDENRRNIEKIRYRYIEMAEEYKKNPTARLNVKRSRIHGWGLFSNTKFQKNDMIVEYIGEKIRSAVADKRELLYEVEGVGSCYLFRLDKDAIVDATRTGGMARFMNHCCEPNAYARVISTSLVPSDSDAEKHIVIFANRDIEEGEEITYDYKFPIEDTKLKCLCNAPRCQGVMN